MRVQFVSRTTGPERLLCDAEVVFEEPGPLQHTKIMGFSVWLSQEGDLYVTVPYKAFGFGTSRWYFDFLQPVVEGDRAAITKTRAWILDEYRRSRAPQPPEPVALALTCGTRAGEVRS